MQIYSKKIHCLSIDFHVIFLQFKLKIYILLILENNKYKKEIRK